jgi:putative transposase
LANVKPAIDLITDGGSENKGEVDVFVNDVNTNLRKWIAQTDIVQSNSMVEAVNKRMKYDFLFTQKSNFNSFDEEFIKQVQHKINRRPRKNLDFKIPKDVFFK